MSIQPIPWYRAWAGILRYPTVYNFEVLLLNPNATRATAYRWLAATGILAGIPSIVLLAISAQQLRPLMGDPPPDVLPVIGIGLVASLVFSSLLGMMGLVISVAIQNIVAKLLGGQGTFTQMIYAEATFCAPLLLISSLLNLISYVGMLTFGIELYGFILTIMAIKAVHQFSWGKAVISSLALVILLLFLFGGVLGVSIFSLSQHP